MTNEISRPGSQKLSPSRALLALFAIVAMAVCALGASIASAATPAKYKSTTKLTGTKTGQPTLAATVSDQVKGGREITKVVIILPSGFSWNKSHVKGHITVKGKRFKTSSIKGRELTVTPAHSSKTLDIRVNHVAIKESTKAEAAKAGKVKLKVTEKAAAKKKTKPSTSSTSGLNALQSALQSIETQLGSGQSEVTTNVNKLVDELTGAGCTTAATELTTALQDVPGSQQVQTALLTAYSHFLLSSLPALMTGWDSIDSLLVPLGYTSTQPLTDLVNLSGTASSLINEDGAEFCSDMQNILTTDSTKTLTSIESTLESQLNSYAGDISDYQAAFSKLETTLTKEASALQSVLSPDQLSTLESLITGISGDLGSLSGAGSSLGSGSNPLASALQTLLNTIGASSITSGGSDPLTELQTALSSTPLGTLLGDLEGLLGGSGLSGL